MKRDDRLPFGRAGLRLAAAQAAVVILAFGLAGYLAEASLKHITQRNTRDQILGEAASLDDEVAQKGLAHLPLTVAKRSRLWRGFEYRLADAQGHQVAGNLTSAVAAPGWSQLQGRSRDGRAATSYTSYSHRLADGGLVTVGQDMAVEAGETAAIGRALLECGLLGVGVCVLLSTLVARSTWRRISAISEAADAVAEGRLDVRAARSPGPAKDDIDALSDAFNGMLDRIEALMAQVRQVSTDIAHDLRTPLNRFSQKLEHLRRQMKGQTTNLRAIAGLEHDLQEIVRTFDALLQLSEIESTEARHTAAPVDLAEIAERVSEAYRPDLEASGRLLKVLAGTAVVAADEHLLSQSLANLIENAIRHTPPGTQITVCARTAGSRGELVVSDDGPGMAVNERARVLKPFVRLSASRSSPGAGLGLSIVAAVARRCGADLSLEDAEPGFRIRLCFPLVAATPTHAGELMPAP